MEIPRAIYLVARAVRRKYPNGTSVGKCVVASGEIADKLLDLGFSVSRLHGDFNGKAHSWVEVHFGGKRMLLDVTADQFGKYPAIWWSLRNNRSEYTYD